MDGRSRYSKPCGGNRRNQPAWSKSITIGAMPRQTVSWPGVGELSRDGAIACLDFVNSEWTDWRGRGEPTDRLGSPEWWKRFLDHWGMGAAGLDAPTRGRIAELRKLRQIMRAVLQKGRRPTRADLAWMDRRLASSPHRWAIGAE